MATTAGASLLISSLGSEVIESGQTKSVHYCVIILKGLDLSSKAQAHSRRKLAPHKGGAGL